MSAFYCDKHGKHEDTVNGKCPECELERKRLEWVQDAMQGLVCAVSLSERLGGTIGAEFLSATVKRVTKEYERIVQ